MRKEDIKLSWFTDDTIIYIENPEEPTKNLLELISDKSKIAGYKFNIQKSITFLYITMNKSNLKLETQ